MKNTKLFLKTLLALIILNCLGCGTWNTQIQTQPASGKAEIRVGEELLKAFLSNDADAFLKLLPEDAKKEFGTQGFKKTRASMIEQLGIPTSHQFVMNLQHPVFIISIWKITYEKNSSDSKSTITQETLFRAVAGRIDGEIKLLSFNFF